MTRPLKVLLILMLMSLVSACSTVSAAGKPTVTITSPANNSQFNAGDQVSVQSTSVSDQGISKVELSVDGNVVSTNSAPQPQNSYTVTQTWPAVTGVHTITVRATNVTNVTSDPTSITVTVGQGTGTTPAPTGAVPTIVATPVVPTTASSSSSSSSSSTLSNGQPTVAPTVAPTHAAACINASTYITDVTIPDGTRLATGQTFNKIWRVRNSGTCTWNSADTLAFVSGATMTTTTSITLPTTAPGQTADLLIPMVAPTTPGLHTSVWRMKNANGAFFGTRLTVVLNVVQTTTSSANSCPFTPAIASFTASPTTITLGEPTTLNWGFVSGAENASIDNGIGGVATPGSITMTPGSTTTYTLTAVCGSKIAQAQVTVTVVSPTAVPTASPVPSPTP